MARRKRKLSGRFFVIIFLLIACIGVATYLLTRGQGESTMTAGALTSTMNVTCAVIRDEACYSAGRFDKVNYIADEGAILEANAPVAQIYRWGYNESTMQSLLNVQKQIYEEQLAINEGVSIDELTTIEDRIAAIGEDIRLIAAGQKAADLVSLEHELKALLEERAMLLKARTQPNESLSGLYETEESRKLALSEWVSDIVAAEAGTVSFYYDGFEQTMNADKIELLNVALLKTMLSGKSSAAEASGESSIAYRLVNPTNWYVAFLTDDASPERLIVGEEYAVYFTGFEETPYIGTAQRVTVEDGSVLNIMSFTQDIGSFLSERNLTAQIRKEASGMRIRKSSIRIEEGITYIEVYRGENIESVPVDVLAVYEEHAIVRAKEGQEALYDGQRYLN